MKDGKKSNRILWKDMKQDFKLFVAGIEKGDRYSWEDGLKNFYNEDSPRYKQASKNMKKKLENYAKRNYYKIKYQGY